MAVSVTVVPGEYDVSSGNFATVPVPSPAVVTVSVKATLAAKDAVTVMSAVTLVSVRAAVSTSSLH